MSPFPSNASCWLRWDPNWNRQWNNNQQELNRRQLGYILRLQYSMPRWDNPQPLTSHMSWRWTILCDFFLKSWLSRSVHNHIHYVNIVLLLSLCYWMFDSIEARNKDIYRVMVNFPCCRRIAQGDQLLSNTKNYQNFYVSYMFQFLIFTVFLTWELSSITPPYFIITQLEYYSF